MVLSNGLAKGIFGAAVLSLTFAAVASGRDLIQQDGSGSRNSSQSDLAGIPATINRAAKTDRAMRTGEAALQTQTVALRLDALANTSVLIRVPTHPVANGIPHAPPSLLMKSRESKATVACEPVVSVLTEVAKRLQPGRCVT